MMKPVPPLTSETRHFWEGCGLGELRYQYCPDCDRAQFPPSIRCHGCFKESLEWHISKKRGTIYSITSVSRSPTEAFRSSTPYLLALVDIEEGFRIMTNVPDECILTAQIGMHVDIYFAPLDGEISMPQARLDKSELITAPSMPGVK